MDAETREVYSMHTDGSEPIQVILVLSSVYTKCYYWYPNIQCCYHRSPPFDILSLLAAIFHPQNLKANLFLSYVFFPNFCVISPKIYIGVIV